MLFITLADERVPAVTIATDTAGMLAATLAGAGDGGTCAGVTTVEVAGTLGQGAACCCLLELELLDEDDEELLLPAEMDAAAAAAAARRRRTVDKCPALFSALVVFDGLARFMVAVVMVVVIVVVVFPCHQ